MISFSMAKAHIKVPFMIILNIIKICGQMIMSPYMYGKFIWITFKQSTQDKHTAF